MSEKPNNPTGLFDGQTIDRSIDEPRLASLLKRVHAVMADGEEHSLKAIQAKAGGSEAGVSARLRDLRKDRFGGHTINRRREKAGLFLYRLVIA